MRRSIIFICLGLIGCGTVPSVRPIGKGKKAITLSSGGPVTPVYGIKIPVPYAVLRYRCGLSGNTDLHIGIHPTMLILGNIGLDIGLTRQFINQSGWRPSLSAEGSIYSFYHFDEMASIRAYPEITLIGSYRKENGGQMFYLGVQNMIQYTKPYLVAAPLVGFELPFGRYFIVNLETKWYAPSEESEDRVVDYNIRPFDHGAIGFVFGLSYKL